MAMPSASDSVLQLEMSYIFLWKYINKLVLLPCKAAW